MITGDSFCFEGGTLICGSRSLKDILVAIPFFYKYTINSNRGPNWGPNIFNQTLQFFTYTYYKDSLIALFTRIYRRFNYKTVKND